MREDRSRQGSAIKNLVVRRIHVKPTAWNPVCPNIKHVCSIRDPNIVLRRVDRNSHLKYSTM